LQLSQIGLCKLLPVDSGQAAEFMAHLAAEQQATGLEASNLYAFLDALLPALRQPLVSPRTGVVDKHGADLQ